MKYVFFFENEGYNISGLSCAMQENFQYSQFFDLLGLNCAMLLHHSLLCLKLTSKSLCSRFHQPGPRFLTCCHIISLSKSRETPRTISVTTSSQETCFSLTHTIFKLLSECCKIESLGPVLQIQGYITKSGLLCDPKFQNQLIKFYSKCSLFGYARKLFDESSEPDMISLSSFVSGYAQSGFCTEAILAFYRMHRLGVRCNEFTFSSILKACAVVKNLGTGKQVHGIVVVSGFVLDVFVANTLVVVYAKCDQFADARRLFDEIPERNVVSWNALFSCYVHNGNCGEAMELFTQMILSGIKPDEYSLSAILNTCTGLESGVEGRKIHGYLIKFGHESDSFSANALVNMYAKVGDLEDAIAVFERVSGPNIVSWNSIIAACVLHEYYDWALELFRDMKSSGLHPNMFTLSSILKACSGLGLGGFGRLLHASLFKMDMELDLFVYVGLIDMYFKCKMLENARRVYDLMPKKDLIARNAVFSGYALNGEDKESLLLFNDMHKEGTRFNNTTLTAVLKSIANLQASSLCKQLHGFTMRSGFEFDLYVANGLINSYGKCNLVQDSSKLFRESSILDLASFTSLITAYAQCGQGEEALELFVEMQNMRLEPDQFICSSLLNACANLSAYEQGKQVHVHVVKYGFMLDVFAGNSLVNMYAKCGSLDEAHLAFSKIPERGIVSWSAMIGGLAQHGQGNEALHLFDQMLREGIPPNHITMVNVLCACNHAGLVDEAKRYFDSIKEVYGLEPTQEHYACMVDILGRAGKLDEAMELVNTMPFEANSLFWGPLLGAARTHKNVDLGQWAADMLFTLEQDKSGSRVLLANIYASVGLWENVAMTRRLMRESKVKKEPGMSWIEVKDGVHIFLVGDKSHPRSMEIYAKLDELGCLLNEAGYVPMVEADLHDVERSEKELLLCHHSEKLAVAFGLIATPAGAPIRVKKNLRVCLDCHTAFKFICKIVSREIILRDTNRFHHFKDGSCSCGDYW